MGLKLEVKEYMAWLVDDFDKGGAHEGANDQPPIEARIPDKAFCKSPAKTHIARRTNAGTGETHDLYAVGEMAADNCAEKKHR